MVGSSTLIVYHSLRCVVPFTTFTTEEYQYTGMFILIP